jgi:hypothetical protein
MKTVEQVLEMGDKESVDVLAGIITSVESPREPSAAQEAKGIHVQNFTIRSSQGTTLNCQFLNAAMHFDKEARGDKIILKAADTEKGPYGLQVNVYQGKVSLVISKHATYILKPQQEGNIAAAEQGKMRELPPQQTPKQRVTGSIDNASLAYAQIYKSLCAALGQDIPLKDCASSVSTIFIEGGRGGWLYDSIASEPKGTIPAPLPKTPKTPAAPDPKQVVRHIVDDSISGNLFNRIDQADRAVRTIEGVSWDAVLDGLVSTLADSHQMTVEEILPYTNKVYDATRRNMGPANAATDVPRAIALEFFSFRDQVHEAIIKGNTPAEEKAEEPTTTIDPYSDIPV